MVLEQPLFEIHLATEGDEFFDDVKMPFVPRVGEMIQSHGCFRPRPILSVVYIFKRGGDLHYIRLLLGEEQG